MQEVCISFNRGLDFDKFDKHDLQMIKEDKDFLFGQMEQDEREHRAYDDPDAILNEIEDRPVPLMDKDPNTPLFDDVYDQNKQCGRTLPRVLESIFLRYLPAPFVKFLFEHGKSEFLTIFRS